jgi:hypothetical protein
MDELGPVTQHVPINLFLSWSGDRSRAVAFGLRDWLPDVLQDIRPFMSEHDIGAGIRWASSLGRSLESTDIGIVCLTPENLNAPWVLFEAGSLAKKLDVARVIPFRLDLKATEVPFPLAQFQSLDAGRDGALTLLKTLNCIRSQPMETERLERLFTRLWGDLETNLKMATAIPAEKSQNRTERELLEEILQSVRSGNLLSAFRMASVYHDFAFEHIGNVDSVPPQTVTAEVYWHAEGFTRDDALEFCGVLKNQGISCRLAEHVDKHSPDAIFIGALVPAELARLVLRAVPYKIKYIFRPDYPEEQGGSSNGLKLGVGYRSTHFEAGREPNAEPVPLSDDDLADLAKPTINNVEFHVRLRRITNMT